MIKHIQGLKCKDSFFVNTFPLISSWNAERHFSGKKKKKSFCTLFHSGLNLHTLLKDSICVWFRDSLSLSSRAHSLCVLPSLQIASMCRRGTSAQEGKEEQEEEE